MSEAAPKSKWRRWLLTSSLYVAFLLVILEISTRSYFAYRTQSSFFSPDVRGYFYPNLSKLQQQQPNVSRDDESLDVLLLGGSVLHPHFGSIAERLQKQLSARVNVPVRVFNLADAAHTSRDSLNKYRQLDEHRFDLVIFYHGINETRFNDCPPDAFRNDYTHIGWYSRVAAIEDHPELPILTLPYSLHFLWIRIKDQFSPLGRHGLRQQNQDRIAYDEKLRTVGAFAKNVQEIVRLAQRRGDPLVLMSFATYLPAGYDESRPHDEQRDGVNDYGGNGTSQIKQWGAARRVIPCVKEHNRVLSEIARSETDVLFVDQAKLIPQQGAYFTDVCHLAESGCHRWVDNALPVIMKHIPTNMVRR